MKERARSFCFHWEHREGEMHHLLQTALLYRIFAHYSDCASPWPRSQRIGFTAVVQKKVLNPAAKLDDTSPTSKAQLTNDIIMGANLNLFKVRVLSLNQPYSNYH